MRKIMMGSILTLLGLSGCNLPGGIGLVPNPTRLPTVIASSVPTEAPTDTATSEPTLAPTETETSPPTETPLPSDTPTQTLTPTPESLTGTGTKQAFCRWGPGSDYIEAGVYLYPDDVVLVHGQTLT